MELLVQELLQKIKNEGVDSAKKEADSIIASAHSKAEGIVASAEKKALHIEAQSKAKAEATEEASRLALVQASRDSLLGLRHKVQVFMQDAVLAKTGQMLDSKFLSALLPDLLSAMIQKDSSDISILLSEKNLASLDDALANTLSEKIGHAVTFRPFAGLDAGFRVVMEGSNAQYDFSAESIAAILASRVNSRLAECILAASRLEKSLP
jgi:V/A-type H+-transporting ATPase subunit E